ncbi:hypothetical protein JTB14_037554 [Gonioctena quinquepunctata]|nr:hypothetical protein JTB14_037554 [Gonioctena quinquepunctata]
MSVEDLGVNFASVLSRVKKLTLKPAQKVDLITTYLVPHYLHRLTLAIPSLNEIRALDQELRVVIREILHLPQATTNGLLYCGKKDGGLGIPRLEWLLTSATLKASLKFVDNPDPVMQALSAGTKMESRLQSLARAARINWPVDPAILKSCNTKMRKRELARWNSQGSQGKSIAASRIPKYRKLGLPSQNSSSRAVFSELEQIRVLTGWP